MLEFFGHPFSAYTWKALIALYENATPFDFRMLDPDHPENGAVLAKFWPLGKFPLLLDGDKAVFEATSIIEHLAVHHPGRVPLIPANPVAALPVRHFDRVFDNHVMTPMQAIVFDALRPADTRDVLSVTQAKTALDTIYAWLDSKLEDREWATGTFSMADCAAAPSLFYADWAHPIPERHATLKAYRARLIARPSVARCIDEARPYRAYFPPGAPDRD